MNKDTNKEMNNEKTTLEKYKESFLNALMSAGIVLVVLFIIWIPFKLIPAIFGNGSNFVSTTLSSMFVSGDATSTNNQNTQNNNSEKQNTGNKSGNNNVNLTQTSSNTNTQIQRVYSGKPDLAISVIGTGIIDPASGQFMMTNYAGANDEVAIRFEVKNIGTNVSGAWKLRINSPSKTTPYYDSAYQTSIRPGDKIIYTTSFDSPTSIGINTAYITADPLNMVDEILENNNQISVPIKIEGTTYSYNNNYNYGTYSYTPSPYGTLYSWSNINVNCYANPQNAYVGSPVIWYASASGGNGYFSYAWVGSDQMYANESTVSKIYYSSGVKTATVTVTSNGQSVTKQCSTYVY